MPRVHTALADASWSFGSEEKGVGVAAMRDVTARTIPWIPPTDRTGRGRPVDGIMPAGGLTETTRQTTSAEDPSSDAISFCLPIKWRLPVGTRYGYPKPTHQSGASGGCSCDSRPAEGWTAEAAIAFGEFVQPDTTTLSRVVNLATTSKKRYLVHLVSDASAAFVRQPSGQACRSRSAHSNALCPIKKLEGVGSRRPETCSSRVDGLPETNSTSRWTCSMTTPAACSRCSFCSLQALRRCCSCWSV